MPQSEAPAVAALDLKALERAADGVDALRDVLLAIAIRGALVPQQDSDGSGTEVLKRLPHWRRPAADSEAATPPLPIPRGWCWARLSDLGRFVGGGTPTKSNAAFWDGPVPWVSPKDMKRPYISDAEDHISKAALGASAAKLIPAPSALFVLRGMILAHSFPVAITKREVAINQDMRALVLDEPALAPFLLRVLQAARRRVLAHVERSSHGTCRLDSSVVENLLIPIPPMKEQKRIVAKVDQLMAFCDELETKQAKKREFGDRLTKAALAALTSAEAPEEFKLAWQRISENFVHLVDKRDQVSAIRASILDLAVAGGLVAQGSVREHQEAGAFPIPAHWRWAPGSEVFSFVTSGSRGWAQYYSDTGPIFLRIGNLDYESIELDLQEIQRVRPPSGAEGTRTKVQTGDILVSITGDTGMVGLVREGAGDAYINQHIALARPVSNVLPEYVARALTAPKILGAVQRAQRGIKNSLGLEDIRNIVLPLPPLDEQKRIVAKVNQLMALCDELESKLVTRDGAASRIADALVAPPRSSGG